MKLLHAKVAELPVQKDVQINVQHPAVIALVIVMVDAEVLVELVVLEHAPGVQVDADLHVKDVVLLADLDVAVAVILLVKLPVKMDVQLIVMLTVLAELNKKIKGIVF